MKRLALVVIIIVCAAPGSAWALGFGANVGQIDAKSGASGESRGVFGRVALLGPLDLELHVARIDYDDQGRSDRQLGVGLHLDVFPWGKWAPYLLAGTGVIEVEVDSWSGRLVYDELGVGLAYRFNDKMHLELDYREGHLAPIESDKIVPAIVMPGNQRDEYTQINIGLSLDF